MEKVEMEELTCGLRLQWRAIGQVEIDDQSKLRFPRVSTAPGIYRFRISRTGGTKALYIGESDNLQRRFSHYRTPGPTQQTNLRISALLLDLLGTDGEVAVAVSETAWITMSSNEKKADFSYKSHRRLFEQFAITAEHASDIESLNR